MKDEIVEKGAIADQVEEIKDEYYDAPYGMVSSFDDLAPDALMELSDSLQTLTYIVRSIVSNISGDMSLDDSAKFAKIQKEWAKYVELASGLMSEYGTENKSKSLALVVKDWASNLLNKDGKTEGGVVFPASDFAFVPDKKKPSTWKLRIAEGKPGNVTIAQLGRAAAAFSSGGFRGNKVELPAGAVAAAKRKIRAAYKRLGVSDEKIPDSVKSKSDEGMMIWKDATTNQYRWLAVYSNSYRDIDNPPEIISEKSHMTFVENVDSGKLAMPELWHWHVKDSKYGQADFVGYDADSGFAIASGYILPGHEAEAEALAGKSNIKVSHGMPPSSIVRDPNNPSVIVGHATVEISDLPDWAAANPLTGFMIYQDQEDTMALPKEKKEYLKSLGVDVEAIEKNLDLAASKALELGIERKEITPAPEPEVPVAEAPTEMQGATPAVEDKVAETDEKEKSLPNTVTLSAADVASIVTEVMAPFYQQIADLQTVVKELKEVKPEVVSPASMMNSAQLIAAMINKNMSAIGSKETSVNKNANLAKDGPVQTDPDQASAAPENLLGRVITSIINPS
jgi:hypothetical protein